MSSLELETWILIYYEKGKIRVLLGKEFNSYEEAAKSTDLFQRAVLKPYLVRENYATEGDAWIVIFYAFSQKKINVLWSEGQFDSYERAAARAKSLSVKGTVFKPCLIKE